jgi:serine/threonine-protein kinase
MTKPIPVTVAGLDGDKVALAFDVAGATIGRHEASIVAGDPSATALVPAPFNPYVVAGQTTAVLTVLNGQTPTATYRFGINSTQPATTTGLAVGSVALALFAAAYLESYLRALRRGRSRFSATVGFPLSAAMFAVAVVGAAWVLLGHEPTVTTLAVSTTLAAVGGIAATIAAMRVGRTYRYRRSRRALERALATKLHRGERWSLVRQ